MSRASTAGTTRLYHVTGQHGESRIVDAVSRAAAINHVNKDYWSAAMLSPADALRLGGEGILPESAEPKSKRPAKSDVHPDRQPLPGLDRAA